MPVTEEQVDPRLLDKAWRISHLYKIKDKNANLIPFTRNRAQADFSARKTHRNIILKSRQLGFTTDTVVDSLDDVLFRPNYDALILSYDQQSQTDIFANKAQLAWDHFPLSHLYSVENDRSNMLKFGFGDKRTSSLSVRMSGRSGTYHKLHVSEFAKICKSDPARAKEIITGTFPAVPLDGTIDIESTAEGEFGYFYTMFWEAWERQLAGRPPLATDFTAFFYNWTYDDLEIAKVTPVDLDLMPREFHEIMRKHKLSHQQISYYFLKWVSLGRDWESLLQEYPTTPEEAFRSSGRKFFQAEKVELLEAHEQVGERTGDLVVFEDYNPRHRYAIGADPSEGTGNDASALVVMDFTSPVARVVAQLVSRDMPPEIFAYELARTGNRYGTCLIAVERNNIGHAVLMKLKDIYPLDFIYTEIRTGNLDDKTTTRMGWNTTVASKPQMMYDIATAVHDEAFYCPSRMLRMDMKTYDADDVGTRKRNDDSPHWDVLTAAAIAFQMRTHNMVGARDRTRTYTHVTSDDLHSGI